jgi:hypothetical protein
MADNVKFFPSVIAHGALPCKESGIAGYFAEAKR